MGKIHFFTDPDKIQSQTLIQSFGALDEFEYNLENRFTPDGSSAPIYAVTKSLLFWCDSTDSGKVNIALKPCLGGDPGGIPIEFFIYRGVDKSSLDSAILDNPYPGTLTDDLKINKIFFDNTDGFQPNVVNTGFHIGDASSEFGFQIVLNKLGHEILIEDLKKVDDLFVPELESLPVEGTAEYTEKNILKVNFKNRCKKEKIINYLDGVAFYGSIYNSDGEIHFPDTYTGSGTEFMNGLQNSSVVYIDMRNEWGDSYNHFFKQDEYFQLNFLNEEIPIFQEVNYYEQWPILAIYAESYAVGSNSKYFSVKVPIITGGVELTNILSIYSGKISTTNSKAKGRHNKIEFMTNEGLIALCRSFKMRFWNKSYDNDDLIANYFLIKLSTIGLGDYDHLPSIWKPFFSFDLDPLFETDAANFDSRDYVVRTYSSLNSPPIFDLDSGDIYFGNIGIAYDKENVTLFSIFEEDAYSTSEFSTQGPLLSTTGKFKNLVRGAAYDSLDLQNKNIGFLEQMFLKYGNSGYDLQVITDTDEEGSYSSFFYNRGAYKPQYKKFNSICFKRAEFENILSAKNQIESTYYAANEYAIEDQPIFLLGGAYKKIRSQAYRRTNIKVFIGITEISGSDDIPKVIISSKPMSDYGQDEIKVNAIEINTY